MWLMFQDMHGRNDNLGSGLGCVHNFLHTHAREPAPKPFDKGKTFLENACSADSIGYVGKQLMRFINEYAKISGT